MHAMENKSLIIKYTLFRSLESMNIEDASLVKEAISMLGNSYAPYSRFRVGSAVMLDDKTIVRGSNQENAAYPSGLCAERVALFSAGANYPERVVRKIAIAACNESNVFQAAFPCGGCLQVLTEYEQRAKTPIRIIVFKNNDEIYVFDGVKRLLPFTFML